MITEDYVSYEVAKLLKEKGFDWPCLAHWYIGSEAHEKFSDYPINWNEVKSDLDWLSRPTHQMAMAWLREVHKIHIEISVQEDNKYMPFVYKREGFRRHWRDEMPPIPLPSSYEEAVEAALKYCLENLI